ncbi:MAG: hypothetical protein ACXWNX_12655 [Isosphaeraceae bacterium]
MMGKPLNPLATMVRPVCDRCAAPVQWFGMGSSLAAGFGEEAAHRMVEELDSMWPDGDEAEYDFWKCTKCESWGALVVPEGF